MLMMGAWPFVIQLESVFTQCVCGGADVQVDVHVARSPAVGSSSEERRYLCGV